MVSSDVRKRRKALNGADSTHRVVSGRRHGRGSDGGAKPHLAGAMTLRALRDSVRKTQGDLARATKMSQPQLSRVEGRRDHLISTLRKYVRALGGDIEVVALVDGRRITLRDV